MYQVINDNDMHAYYYIISWSSDQGMLLKLGGNISYFPSKETQQETHVPCTLINVQGGMWRDMEEYYAETTEDIGFDHNIIIMPEGGGLEGWPVNISSQCAYMHITVSTPPCWIIILALIYYYSTHKINFANMHTGGLQPHWNVMCLGHPYIIM